jgi:UDPglucose--hexose-1-phosphate uridylyltransferase
MTTKKIAAKLFDGRDIFYYDDAGSALSGDRKNDSRAATARAASAELRLDPLTSDWVAVAAARDKRAFLPPAHQCPLCPASENNASEVPDIFDVAVFENKTPSFGPIRADSNESLEITGDLELGATRYANGRCEVVVFSPEHEGSLAGLSLERFKTLIDVWADRTKELNALPDVKQIFIFENRGEEIGVTLHHPHGQIYAYPFVPGRIQKVLQSIETFGADLFEQILTFEKNSERVLIAGEHFTAYVPFAARWPIEVHVLPHRHVQNLGELTQAEKAELAEIYKKLLVGLERIYETPLPYISAWHQAPNTPEGKNVRLQLQITSPKRGANSLKFWAGSESSMSAFVADVSAESIAALVRGAL